MQPNYDDRHLRARNAFGWIIMALVLVVVIAFTLALATHNYPYSPMMPYYGYPYFGWFFFPFGFVIFIIFIALIGRLIFWPWGRGYRRRYWYRYGDAREILRQRYASGEITKEQYDQMMRDLEQH